MKNKLSLFILFCFFVLNSYAQKELIYPQTIQWTGVQKWYSDSLTKKVISFDGAQYPDESFLPYFDFRYSCDPAFSYSVDIINPTFVQLTNEEKLLVSDTSSFNSRIQVLNSILKEKGNNILDIRVLPFVNNNGVVMKLSTFQLRILQSTEKRKAASTNYRSYSNSSVLSQGKFVKIRIKDTGVYKLTYDDLKSMGVDPANVRVFGYGGGVLDQDFTKTKPDDLPEVAIWMEKGSDGVFNSGDYILFYGQGVQKWTFDSSKGLFTHQINIYSNYGYYFVTSDAGTGKKIADKTITLPAGATINPVTEFIDYQVYEKDQYTLISSGKELYGEIFNETTSYNFNFNFPNISTTTGSLKLRLDVAAASTAVSTFSLNLNGAQTKSLSVPAKTAGDQYVIGMPGSGTYSFDPTSDVCKFGLTYNKSTNTSIGYLNYIEINARRALKMDGACMQFQNTDNIGQSAYNKYILSNSNSDIKIWNITDPLNIYAIPTELQSGIMSFTESGYDMANYLAVNTLSVSSFSKPEIIGTVDNQNLHAMNPVDLLIITYPDFVKQAEILAQAHRSIDSLRVGIVTTDQVYNEFSSGTPDATAYRWVSKMFYDRALTINKRADLPKYVLLMGRGSYDNRKLIPNSGDNLILTYQAENSLTITSSYVTDDYFGMLDDGEGTQIPSNMMDVGVGRLPVKTVDEASEVVSKLVGYMQNTKKGIWKNQLCFLADDGDASLHAKQADSIAVSLARKFPAYQINKIYLDAYLQETSASGQTYPLAKTQLSNLFRSGLLFFDYTGHAGPLGLTNETLVTISGVKIMSNKNLPFWMGATCDFLQFDGLSVSGGEQVMLNPLGGGIGIMSAARPVYASQNYTLNKLVCDNLLKKQNGKNLRLGDIISYAKNNVGAEYNKLSYVFMGDPALKLNYPSKYQVKTTKINQSTVFGNDTLRALSVATVQGSITDDSDNLVSTFNGELNIAVYDKIQRITTLNNEGDGSMTYSDRPNKLFSGKAVVKNGLFSLSFMLPKDIKYNFGGGRINYCANDTITGDEAQGWFENFIVGGTASNVDFETDGPVVAMYLNSTNFVSGDQVNETPFFFADLSDIHGINRVGSGIGHDMLLTVDQDPAQSYVVNDYFVASSNSYTSGVVSYKLPELANGKHTLTFRAWDLLNNSTTKTIDFEVVKGLQPVIFSISNFPNPVRNSTTIVVKHDRPETILETTVDIYDIAGRKVWSFSQSSADDILWNLNTSEGLKVKTGVYLYRVSIKNGNNEVYSKINKMLIIEQ